jgi:hypothetical protein
VLDERQVVETGDHETLMRMGGLYRQLFDTQARGYKPTADGPAPGKNNPTATPAYDAVPRPALWYWSS